MKVVERARLLAGPHFCGTSELDRESVNPTHTRRHLFRMLHMRALLRASPNLPPAVHAARDLGDDAVARALFDLGLECPEIKELLDREDCAGVEARSAA